MGGVERIEAKSGAREYGSRRVDGDRTVVILGYQYYVESFSLDVKRKFMSWT